MIPGTCRQIFNLKVILLEYFSTEVYKELGVMENKQEKQIDIKA